MPDRSGTTASPSGTPFEKALATGAETPLRTRGTFELARLLSATISRDSAWVFLAEVIRTWPRLVAYRSTLLASRVLPGGLGRFFQIS
jgi:hypothetical protein